MQLQHSAVGDRLTRAVWGVLLFQLSAAGVFMLLYFWRHVLHAEDFASLGLPVVATAAAIASTFNPCSLPALPGFIAASGAAAGEEVGLARRLRLSAAASLGAATVVAALGVLVALVGSRTKDLVEPNFRWVQLVVAIVLVALGGLHLAGRTSRLPLVGSMVGLGSRAWEAAIGKPTTRSSFVWGAGFVGIGAG